MFIEEDELTNLVSKDIADHLCDRFVEVEKDGTSVKEIFLGIRDYAEIRKYMPGHMTPETQEGLFQSGVIRRLWGAKLIVTNGRLPEGVIRITDTYEKN